MILVELYSKEECSLCEVAKGLLLKVQRTHPFEFRQILIHQGDEYFDRFKERIPIVFINKEFAFQYKVSEKELLTRLFLAERDKKLV